MQRLEEKENELKREYTKLHERYTEVRIDDNPLQESIFNITWLLFTCI